MTELRVADRSTLLAPLPSATVTRDIIPVKTLADQYLEVVEARSAIKNAAGAAVVTYKNAPTQIKERHPNWFVASAGRIGFGVAALAAGTGAAILDPSGGLWSIVGLAAGSTAIGGGLGSAFGTLIVRKTRTNHAKLLGTDNKEKLRQNIASAITNEAKAKVEQQPSALASVIIGENAEKLLAESVTTQPLYDVPEARELLEALVARGDAQSPDDIARAHRLADLADAVAVQGAYRSTPDAVLSAYDALTHEEQSALADAIYGKLFESRGAFSEVRNNEHRASINALAGKLLDARIAYVRIGAPEPSDAPSAKRLVEQTRTLHDLLAGCLNLTTLYPENKRGVTDNAKLEAAISLTHSGWLTADERAAFHVAIGAFKTANSGNGTPLQAALVPQLNDSKVASESTNDAVKAAKALTYTLSLPTRRNDGPATWKRAETELASLPHEYKVAVAETLNDALFGEGNAANFATAPDVLMAIRRILRGRA